MTHFLFAHVIKHIIYSWVDLKQLLELWILIQSVLCHSQNATMVDKGFTDNIIANVIFLNKWLESDWLHNDSRNSVASITLWTSVTFPAFIQLNTTCLYKRLLKINWYMALISKINHYKSPIYNVTYSYFRKLVKKSWKSWKPLLMHPSACVSMYSVHACTHFYVCYVLY